MASDHHNIDPGLRTALDSIPNIRITQESLSELREAFSAPPAPDPRVQTQKLLITTSEQTVPVIIYRKSHRPLQPLLVWAHGGGFVFGSAEDIRARNIAHDCDCTVVSVDYRLAPENPYPAAVDDVFCAIHWLVEHAESIGIDANRVALGGTSAGGGIAAGVALQIRDHSPLVLRCLLLLSPMLDNLHATVSGSMENHVFWNRKASLAAWEMYLGGEPGKEAPIYAAPARAQEVRGHPPTYVCVGSEDLFRDETIDYARKLLAAGVAVELAVYPGMFHGAEVLVPDAPICERMRSGYMSALLGALVDD